ncbi:hypothetical protein AAG570_001520 [Ranatra chinensis]|uniref:Uncharacterized protein n=1 Tax=Ranatra chinensis TaxID=642074 RepID=A0ABD0YKU1_9HEMI
MASKRRNMFYENEKQETTEIVSKYQLTLDTLYYSMNLSGKAVALATAAVLLLLCTVVSFRGFHAHVKVETRVQYSDMNYDPNSTAVDGDRTKPVQADELKAFTGRDWSRGNWSEDDVPVGADGGGDADDGGVRHPGRPPHPDLLAPIRGTSRRGEQRIPAIHDQSLAVEFGISVGLPRLGVMMSLYYATASRLKGWECTPGFDSFLATSVVTLLEMFTCISALTVISSVAVTYNADPHAIRQQGEFPH